LRRSWFSDAAVSYFLQQVLNGLQMGAIYALLAFGYAAINALLHRTNLAHGAVFGFAGQMIILTTVFGWQVLWLTLPAALAFGAVVSTLYALLVSAILSRFVFEPLARGSPNTIVAATLGVALVLMESARIAADTRDFWLPPILQQPVAFAVIDGRSITLTLMQVANCGIALLALLASSLLLARTAFGRAWSAVSDDPDAAALCGTDTRRIFRLTVIGAGLLASLAGILAALHFGNLGFGAGLVFGLKVLFVTAVGGYRRPSVAAVGALAFGVGESLWTGYFPAEWRDGWMFALLAAMLILRSPASLPETASRPADLR
jgi:branched-chain amino acid transport system permease protein